MGGAFQVSREIFENEVWSDVVKFRIFFYILGNAVFSKEGVDKAGIRIERGQYLRSMRNLQDDLSYREGRGNALKKYPLTTIQRKIKSLEKEGRINTKSTEYGTLFTVVNYATYQGFEHYQNQSVEQQRNSDGTVMEQRRNNNKKVKKDKNVNKKDYTSKIKDLLPVFSSIENFNQLNKKYWDAIRETRKTGSVSKSVIYNNMTKWQKYDLTVIEYALKTHVESHKGKKEDYTIGIMRNTSKEEAAERLRSGVKPYKNNVVQIPSYGGESDGKSNEQHSNEFGNVKLYK